MKTPEILKSAADLYEARNLIYKDSYKNVGGIFQALFPNGITLSTDHDYNRFSVLMHILNKIMRYSANWPSGHPDSLKDLVVYAAMLLELDEENRHE